MMLIIIILIQLIIIILIHLIIIIRALLMIIINVRGFYIEFWLLIRLTKRTWQHQRIN